MKCFAALHESVNGIIFNRFNRFCLPAHFRFAPRATEMLRCREMTRRAIEPDSIVAANDQHRSRQLRRPYLCIRRETKRLNARVTSANSIQF